MKIVVYCQHVLGIGHFFRTLEICRKLMGHDVTLISGGETPDVHLPAHVQEMRLPGLMMDADFKHMFPTEAGKSIEAVKSQRQDSLFRFFEATSPDIFMIELYPFGRKAFRFELDPVLEAIRDKTLPSCRVVCSLRDVLVEKTKTASYEARVIKVLNRYFDALLIHSDPNFLTLDRTFSRMDDITLPIVYTGFVTPKPEPGSGKKLRKKLGIAQDDPFLVASAGGGKVGGDLLTAVVKAFPSLPKNCHLQVFTGPFLSDDAFSTLKSYACKAVHVDRFSRHFLAYLDAADLSVSMAGYNTSMNIMAADTPALVWPFGQNREQRLRAEQLSRLGGLQILSDDDLDPIRLADLMTQRLFNKKRSAGAINLDGAEKTADWLLREKRL